MLHSGRFQQKHNFRDYKTVYNGGESVLQAVFLATCYSSGEDVKSVHEQSRRHGKTLLLFQYRARIYKLKDSFYDIDRVHHGRL